MEKPGIAVHQVRHALEPPQEIGVRHFRYLCARAHRPPPVKEVLESDGRYGASALSVYYRVFARGNSRPSAGPKGPASYDLQQILWSISRRRRISRGPETEGISRLVKAHSRDTARPS